MILRDRAKYFLLYFPFRTHYYINVSFHVLLTTSPKLSKIFNIQSVNLNGF